MNTKATYWIKIEGNLEKSNFVMNDIQCMFDEYFGACKVDIKELTFEVK